MLDASRPRARRPRTGLLRRADRAGATIALAVLVTVQALAAGVLPAPADAAPAPISAPSAAVAPGADAGASAPITATPRVEASDAYAAAVAPVEGGVVLDALVGGIVVENRTDEDLAATTATISVSRSALGGPAEVDAWSAGDAAAPLVEVLTIAVPPLRAHESREVPFTVGSAALPFDATTPFGIYGLGVEWHPGSEIITGRSTLIWSGGTSDTAPVDLTVIVPLVAPLGTQTLLTAQELAELTAEDAPLTGILDAVEGTSATLAIDPRLLVSIRALGTDAPTSARDWLRRLETSGNPAFPLEFADASLTLQAAAGLDAPLEPNGFSFATQGRTPLEPAPAPTATAGPDEGTASDPAAEGEDAEPGMDDETGAEGTEADGTGAVGPEASDTDAAATDANDSADSETAPTETAPTQAAPTQTAPDGETAAPDAPDLAAFSWSTTRLAWPEAGTTTNADLATLGEWRPGQFLLPSTQFDAPPACAPQVDVGGTTALVDDAALGADLATAITAPGSIVSNTALAEATAHLAARSLTAERDSCPLVVTLPRDLVAAEADPGPILDGLADLAWLRFAEPPAPDAATGLPSATLIDGAPHAGAADLAALLPTEAAGVGIADLYDDPTATAEQLRAELVRLASASWFGGDANWDAARADYTTFATGVLDRVGVVAGSDVQLIGHASSIPVFIRNDTDRRVTIHVALRATTGHLDFPQAAAVSIEPHSTARAEVPVQAIANGLVHVNVALATPKGTPIGAPAAFNVNVNSDLETVLVSILLGAVGLLFIGGLIRTIQRRRRTIARSRIREEILTGAIATDVDDADHGADPDRDPSIESEASR